MAKFVPMLTAPSTTDKNWIVTSKGGYNRCVEIKNGSVLPNCTGYVWGAWRKRLGNTHNLSTNQAEIWYLKNDGYQRGKTPKLGAVICWAKGSASTYKDGSGHVASVEKIYPNGDIEIGQSGANSKRFWTSKLKAPDYYFGKGYTFQGFIYMPIEWEEEKVEDNEVSKLQKVLNEQYNCGLEVDGKFGNNTTKACNKNYLYKGKKAKKHVMWLQERLIAHGFEVGRYGIDGNMGNDTVNALGKFQKFYGLTVDYKCGAETSKILCK